jgi:hypothetical protein
MFHQWMRLPAARSSLRAALQRHPYMLSTIEVNL